MARKQGRKDCMSLGTVAVHSGEELCGSLPSPSGKQLIKREGS